MRIPASLTILLLLAACGGSSTPDPPKVAPAAAKPAAVSVADESRRFPFRDLQKTAVAADHALGKAYLPPGNIAEYRQGKISFQAFLVKTESSTAAAILLNDVRKNLTEPQLVPSFGGYFGTDAGVPIFVFPKNKWLAGVAGLPQAKADAFAREFAAKLD